MLATSAQALFPNLGRKCGPRERGIDREFSSEKSVETFVAADGGRHPGVREDGVLRGSPLERRPRSVHRACNGTPPLHVDAPATADARRDAKEGNAVRNRSSKRLHRPRDFDLTTGCATSFAWSSGPCTSPPHNFIRQNRMKVARSVRYRGRANLAFAGRNRHRGRTSGRRAARRTSPPPRGGSATRKKRKGVTALVPARIGARVRCPRTIRSCRNR